VADWVVVSSAETPNFAFFDKCPAAILYFLHSYLNTLEETLLSETQVKKAFEIVSREDPMERIEGLRALIQSSRNRSLIKRLVLFLNQIAEGSKDKEVALQCMVGISVKREVSSRY
jgi:hypothetical protein